MQNHRISIIVTLILGIVSIFYFLIMILTLLDIYKGSEPDLSDEWIMVVQGLFIFILFITTALYTTIHLLKSKHLT